MRELLAQRLLAEALGYDDVNDHDAVRRDLLLAVACGKREPLGTDRLHAHDQGVALAAPATLQRLEGGHRPTDRYHKIHADPRRVEATLLDLGVRCLPKHTREIVLDLDSMGQLVHGLQEGRHFSAYYDGYVLSPLYVFAGTVPLWAALRPGDADASLDGVLAALAAIVPVIRRRGKKARLIVRGDSAFAQEETLALCEAHSVYYGFGLARNGRLEAMISDALAAARARRCLTGAASAREFKELEYQTHKSWSRARRVVGTIRQRLLKVAASVMVSVRRVYVQLSSAFPGQGFFRQVARRASAT